MDSKFTASVYVRLTLRELTLLSSACVDSAYEGPAKPKPDQNLLFSMEDKLQRYANILWSREEGTDSSKA